MTDETTAAWPEPPACCPFGDCDTCNPTHQHTQEAHNRPQSRRNDQRPARQEPTVTYATAANKITARTIRQLANQLAKADEEVARLRDRLADLELTNHRAAQTLLRRGERTPSDFDAYMSTERLGETLTLQELAERRMADLQRALDGTQEDQ